MRENSFEEAGNRECCTGRLVSEIVTDHKSGQYSTLRQNLANLLVVGGSFARRKTPRFGCGDRPPFTAGCGQHFSVVGRSIEWRNRLTAVVMPSSNMPYHTVAPPTFPRACRREPGGQLRLVQGGDGVIGGHCGLPFTQIIAGRLWHNAGVIGMPANDGTPRVWYSLLRPREHGLEITHRPLAYDHQSAAAKMRKAGLPAGYTDALSTGRWPSCDVLPAREKLHQGRPLRPNTAVWEHPVRERSVGPRRLSAAAE